MRYTGNCRAYSAVRDASPPNGGSDRRRRTPAGPVSFSITLGLAQSRRLRPGRLGCRRAGGKRLVSSLRQGKTMTIKVIGPIEAPNAGRLVIWAVPADPAKNGAAFVLGNVPASGSAASQLPDTSEKLLSKVSKLIVTVETELNPAQPSSTGVYSGNCGKLW